MTDIKIPSNPLESGAIDAVNDAAESVSNTTETQGTASIAGDGADSIDKIAADVAAGRIGQNEAVDRILADVMGTPMIAAAPESMRRELREMLENLLEDDPHLRSLRAAISPGEIE
ncbi:MAG: hypothetical protein PVH19_15610 [Planctomycetia bacterium]|jgi:hypothetical protein